MIAAGIKISMALVDLLWSKDSGDSGSNSEPAPSPFFGAANPTLPFHEVPAAWNPTAKIFASDPQVIWSELTQPESLEENAFDTVDTKPKVGHEPWSAAAVALNLADRSEEIAERLNQLATAQHHWHELPTRQKAIVLENYLQLGQGYLELAAVAQDEPEDAAYVREELSYLAERSFELAAEFAGEDGDSEVQGLAPLFEGFQHLAAGEMEWAVTSLEKVDHLPEAQNILSRLKQDRTRLLNMAMVETWEAFNREAQAAEWNKSQGAVGILFGAIQYYTGAEETLHDKHYQHWADEEKLSTALKAKLQSGEADTLHEALKQIKNGPQTELAHLAHYYLAPELKYFAGELGPQLAHLVALSENPESEAALKHLQEIAWDLHAREGFVETPLALYTLTSGLGSDSSRQARAMAGRDEIMAALRDEGSWSYSAQKLFHNLNPKDVAEIAPLLIAGGVGNLARLGALARLEAAGITGYRATALAFGAEVLAEGSTLWALNTAHSAAFNDLSQVFTAEHLAKSYGATILMIGGLKGFGRLSQTFAPRLAYGLGLVAKDGIHLSRGGQALIRGLSHLFGMGGMVGTSRVLNWMGLQEAPMGGDKFSILSDVVFYWKFTLLHKVADSMTLGKVSRFQGKVHQEVALREARLHAKAWTSRLGFSMESKAASAAVEQLMAAQLQHPNFSLQRWGRHVARGEFHRARQYLRKHGLHSQLGPFTKNLEKSHDLLDSGWEWIQSHPQPLAALGLILLGSEFLPLLKNLHSSWGLGEGTEGILPLVMGSVQTTVQRNPDLIEYHENHQSGIYDAGTLLMDQVPGRDLRNIFYAPDGNGGRLMRIPTALKRLEIPTSVVDLKADSLAALVAEATRFGIEIELTGNQGWKIVHQGKDIEVYQGSNLMPSFTLPVQSQQAKAKSPQSVSLKILPNAFEMEVLRDLGFEALEFQNLPSAEQLETAVELGFKKITVNQMKVEAAEKLLQLTLENSKLETLAVHAKGTTGKLLWHQQGKILTGKLEFLTPILVKLAQGKARVGMSRLEVLQNYLKKLPVRIGYTRDLLSNAAVQDLMEVLPDVAPSTLRSWMDQGQIFSASGYRHALQKNARDMIEEHAPFYEGIRAHGNGWSKAISNIIHWAKQNPKYQRELQSTFENLARDSEYSSHYQSNAFHLASFFLRSVNRFGEVENLRNEGEQIFQALRQMNKRYEQAEAGKLDIQGTLFDVFLSPKEGGSSEIASLDLLISEGHYWAKEGYQVVIQPNPTSSRLEGPTPDFSVTLTKGGSEQKYFIEVKKAGLRWREWLNTGVDANVLRRDLGQGFRGDKAKQAPSFGEQMGHGLYQLHSQGTGSKKVLEIYMDRQALYSDIKTLAQTMQNFLTEQGLAIRVRIVYSKYSLNPQTGRQEKELAYLFVGPDPMGHGENILAP